MQGRPYLKFRSAPTSSEMCRGDARRAGQHARRQPVGARGSLKLGRDPREVSTRRANIGAPWPRSWPRSFAALLGHAPRERSPATAQNRRNRGGCCGGVGPWRYPWAALGYLGNAGSMFGQRGGTGRIRGSTWGCSRAALLWLRPFAHEVDPPEISDGVDLDFR